MAAGPLRAEPAGDLEGDIRADENMVPTVTPAALIAPEGSFNFRDLGGWPTAGGGRVRTGLLYRCGELDGLTEAGWRRLAEFGVGAIYDLRGEQEVRAGAGHAAGAGIRVHRVPMWGAGEPAQALSAASTGQATDPVVRYAQAKAESYLRMAEIFASGFGRVISGLATSATLPAVFHCAAGKDRTGVLAALILRLLDVDEQDVLMDYVASRGGIPAGRLDQHLPKLRAAGGDEAEFARVHAAHPPALSGVLRHIEKRWGSVERYVTEAAMVAREDVARLRRMLIASPQ